jgi:hypothetical protein
VRDIYVYGLIISYALARPASNPLRPTRLHTRLLPARLRFCPLLLFLLVLFVVILPRIRNLVLEHLDELVEDDGHDGAEARPHPVDPVLDVEDACYDAGPEAARGVQGAACVVDADELGDEEGEADADGGDEGC